VPVIVPLVGVGLLVRRKERKAESLPVFLGVLGGAFLLAAIVCFVLFFGSATGGPSWHAYPLAAIVWFVLFFLLRRTESENAAVDKEDTSSD